MNTFADIKIERATLGGGCEIVFPEPIGLDKFLEFATGWVERRNAPPTTDIAALRRKFRQHPDQRPRTTDDDGWEHPADHWEGGGE